MLFFHLRLSASHSTPSHVPLFGYVEEPFRFHQITRRGNYHLPVLNNWPPLFASVHSLPGFRSLGAVRISADMAEKCDIVNVCQSILSMNSFENQSITMEAQSIHHSDSLESISKEEKERQRRKRIGLANKGRAPWNKGRKHSSETCERIKQRTIEALKDPKVRKKMSEHPHPHSAESKAKMRSSLRRVWGQRLKLKRLRETFFLSWIEILAEAAKKGGSGEDELYWDSYEKIQQELYLQQLQQAAEKKKARAKEMENMRAKKAKAKLGKAKEKKIARLARKKKRDAEVNKDNEELADLQGWKRKQRLMKLHRKISANGQVAPRGDTVMSHISSLEKLDIELIKREKLRTEVSLADQIKAAKNKKMELAMAVSSCVHTVNEKPRNYA